MLDPTMLQSRDCIILGRGLFTQPQHIGLTAALHHQLEQLITKILLIQSCRTIQHHGQHVFRQGLYLRSR